MKIAPVFHFICLLVLLGVIHAGTARAGELGRFNTVVIDAGHGGHDRGGVPGQYVAEKGVALDVALRLQKCLRAVGLRTVMTRSNDVFIPLSGRVAASNSRPGCIFVSIHFNSASNRDARGIETYYYSSKSAPLVTEIHRSLLPISAVNRGIRQRGFYVLRNNRAPAVLVECGFLTNRQDASLAQQARYRQRLAELIAKGIVTTRKRYR